MLQTSRKPLEEGLILEAAKLLFIDWVLQVLRAVTLYFLKIKAGMHPVPYRDIPSGRIHPLMKADISQDESIIQKRWDTCLGCEYLTNSHSCKQCGCLMKTKIKFGKASCPINKWEVYRKEELNVVTATN